MLSVPFAGKIKNGETVKIECVDWYVHSSSHLGENTIANSHMF